jgi:hypothetical protein
MQAKTSAVVLRVSALTACLAACAVIAFIVCRINSEAHSRIFNPGVDGSEVEIVGDERYLEQVDKALALLKNKAPEAYAIVAKNVKRIQQCERSGMAAYETPPTFEMSDKTAFASVTWCAAAIAHDSYHSKLYHDYLDAHPGGVPDDIWTGRPAERQCMKHQIAVMKQIGADRSEIDHAILMSDGHYVKEHETWSDYQNRDY